MAYTTPAASVPRLYVDALDQTHLLIAGASGSGKSVLLNSLLHTAITRPPIPGAGGCQLVLVDVKRVELGEYRQLPHCLAYVSEYTQIIPALEYVLALIDWRYQRAAERGLRKWPGGAVYVVFDEWADIACSEIAKPAKQAVQRICQIGRAAGVHVILCTQCPLATVIPTEVKVNFDARFALRTQSKRDSRNIIERAGCEALPKHGKAYYVTPDTMQPLLVDVPMIPDAERARVLAWWQAQTA